MLANLKRASAVAWAFSAVLAVCAGVYAASASRTADQLQDLMENAWKPSADNYATARDQFESIKNSVPADTRVPLAMALVAIRNFKHADAGQYLDLVLRSASSQPEPSAIAARKLKIWLAAIHKEDATVQSGMHDLAVLLSGDSADAPSLETREAANWLGGALGYYAGPALKTMPMGVDSLQADLTNVLKGPLADELLIGKQAAQKQYQQLQADNVAARADMKAKNEAKRQGDLKQTQAALAATSDKLKKLDDKGDKGKDGKGNKGKNDDQQNQKAYQRLMDERQRIMGEISREMRNRRRNEGQLARLNQQLNGVNQQLNQMSGSSGTNSQQALEAEKKRLQTAEDALNAKSKQLSSSTGDDDIGQSPIEAKMNSLGTYAPVDLDAERQRILDSYAAK